MTTEPEQTTWTFTDRDGRDWTVTETRHHRLLKQGENPYAQVGEVIWRIDGFVVSQPLYAYLIKPQWHREDVGARFQELLDAREE